MRSFLLLRRPVCPNCAAWRTSTLKRQLSSLSGGSNTTASSASLKRPNLPQDPCRTRFAPSPTGYLHLGSLRTALFNYLLAKATNGQFVLRLEDTDQSRLVPDAERRLYDDLKWAGLSWDEGPDVGGKYGPYRQSHRLTLYDKHADQLLRAGKAYRCFCSPEDLENHKRHAHEQGLPIIYPGTCLAISPEESEDRAAKGDRHAVRFKSGKTPTVVQDLVYKRYKKSEPEEDFIIRKRDGFPTYHFANVVDDHVMDITHVVRGAEWLISTPKHVELYDAFGWKPPEFAHVGLLVNKERQKLSKRHPGVDMSWYKNQEILPPALLNFAVLLGWHQGPGKDVMTLQDMVEAFSLKFTRGDIVVTMDKLPYFQRQHTQRLLTEDPPNLPLLTAHFVEPIVEVIRSIESARQNSNQNATPDAVNITVLGDLIPPMDLETGLAKDYILGMLRASRQPNSTLRQYVLDNKYLFWMVPSHVLEQRLNKSDIENLAIDSQPASLEEVMAFLESEFDHHSGLWSPDALHVLLKNVAGRVSFVDKVSGRQVKTGGYNFLRWAFLARENGPGMGDVMCLLGKEETIRRIKLAKEVSATGAPGSGLSKEDNAHPA